MQMRYQKDLYITIVENRMMMTNDDRKLYCTTKITVVIWLKRSLEYNCLRMYSVINAFVSRASHNNIQLVAKVVMGSVV